MGYENYNGKTSVISGLIQENNADFYIARAKDIVTKDGYSVDYALSSLDNKIENNLANLDIIPDYAFSIWKINETPDLEAFSQIPSVAEQGKLTLSFSRLPTESTSLPTKCIEMLIESNELYYKGKALDGLGTIRYVVYDGTWARDQYRTIIVHEEITDEFFLTWLRKNAILISGETEKYSFSKGAYSKAEGYQTTALGTASHTEGGSANKAPDTITSSSVNSTIITSWNSSKFTLAKGDYSHAEGQSTLAIGSSSHAEGNQTQATGSYAHAEGYLTQGTSIGTHAEGGVTAASGSYAHAEGYGTKAAGGYSHAEGYYSQATGSYSNAGGYYSVASGNCAHTHGYETKAFGNQAVFGHYNTDWSSSSNLHGGTSGTSGVLLVVGNGTSSTRSNAFRVEGGGQVKAKGAYSSSGADYAEFFEWLDGNPKSEDRRGYFVTLNGEKIELAQSGDYILGVVSGLPSVIGNGDEDWRGRYIHDDFGAYITEEFEYKEEIFDEKTGETKVITKTATKYKENPDYNPSIPYIPRADRSEWDTVGMLGVLSVRDDETCKVNGYCTVAKGGIATSSDTGYRVIARVNKHIVKIIFR